jgi:proteasome lid subunit RPN8/RPN11
MSRLRATLPAAVRRAIVAHARRDAPRECCGFLIGHGGRILFSLAARNVDPRPKSGYQIDPAEHLAVRRVVRGLVPAVDIIGVYHSHPVGPAVPSPRDIAESHYPEWLYLIVGAGPRRTTCTVRAFRMARHGVTTVQLTSPRR